MTKPSFPLPEPLESLRGGLIASCQAPLGSPLRDPAIVAKIAQATLLGGAIGLRVNGPDDIAAVRAITQVPIIGLFKVAGPQRNIITPDLPSAASLMKAGATIIAVDATHEARGNDFSIIPALRRELGAIVMADVSTLDEGLRAWEAGADVVGTTLSGYTPDSPPGADSPDIELVAALAAHGATVIAEGRYRNPAQVTQAFTVGAHAVVVGTAITDPMTTSAIFARATPRGKG